MKQKLMNSTSVLNVAYWLNKQKPAMRNWYLKIIPLYELERMSFNRYPLMRVNPPNEHFKKTT